MTLSHPEQRGDEVEPADGNEPPVERDDDTRTAAMTSICLMTLPSCVASGT